MNRLSAQLYSAFRTALRSRLSAGHDVHPLTWDDEIACFPAVRAAMFVIGVRLAREGKLGFPNCLTALARPAFTAPNSVDPFTGRPLNLPGSVPPNPLFGQAAAALAQPRVQEAAEEMAQALLDEPITPSDIANHQGAASRLVKKFHAGLIARLGTTFSQADTGRLRSWLDNMRETDVISCFPDLQEALVMLVSRLDAATQLVAQHRNEEHEAQIQQDQSLGYTTITVETFVLDGKKMASRGTDVAITGAYTREGNLDILYADRQAVFLANRGNSPPKVPLLADDATRAFREQLLRCQSSRANSTVGCMVRVLGHVTMCKLSNAFGAEREEPCIAVDDGRLSNGQ